MYHSRLTFDSNRELARRGAAGSTPRLAGAPPPSGSLSNLPFANPLEFDLYQHAYRTTHGRSGTRSDEGGLRAA